MNQKGMGWVLAQVIGIVFLVNAASGAEDKRVVNGVTVDLAPVQEWMITRKGARPLPHWQKLQVLELKGDFGGYERCLVQLENRTSDELLVANLPQQVRAFFGSIAKNTAALNAMRQHVAQSESETQRLHDVWWNNGRVERMVRTTASSTRGPDVDSEDARRAKYDTAKRNLERDRTTLGKMESDHKQLLSRSKSQTTLLAMFSGREWSKLKIWDCGRK